VYLDGDVTYRSLLDESQPDLRLPLLLKTLYQRKLQKATPVNPHLQHQAAALLAPRKLLRDETWLEQ
jgi:hypothetical protein